MRARKALTGAALTLTMSVRWDQLAHAETPPESAPDSASLPSNTPVPFASGSRKVHELPRKVFVKETEGSVFSVLRTSPLPIGKNGAMIPVQLLELKEGCMDLTVGGKPAERGALVQAPSSVVALSSGGRFSIAAKEGRVSVAVHDGEVMVGVSGRYRALAKGMVRTFLGETELSPDKRLVQAPISPPKGSLIGFMGEPKLVPVRFQEVPGALAYRIALLERGKSVPLSETLVSSPANAELFVNAPGSYELEVSSVDEMGHESRPSERSALRVIGPAPLDPHLTPDGRALSLEPGERMSFLETQGLLLRYGSSPEFVVAGPTIGLPGRKITFVEFRDPKEPESSVFFTLVPRLVTARIILGPGRVVWPKDPVQVAVELRDGQGEPVAVDDFQTELSLNGEPIEVPWERSKGTLRATLQPVFGAGPWVVRVRLKNSRGVELARSFLEVVGERRRSAQIVLAER